MKIRMIKVKVDDKFISVELVKENEYTVLVRLPSGSVIKRHKEKHFVYMGDLDEKDINGLVDNDPVVIHSPRYS